MKEKKTNKVIIISLIIMVIIVVILFLLINYKNKDENKTKDDNKIKVQKRYEEIKSSIDKEMQRYLYVIAPNCSSENSIRILTHKDLVYDNGFEKEKLLDVDNKSYCKAYIKAKCVEDGKWDWKTTISCKNYTDKEYIDWDESFPSKE